MQGAGPNLGDEFAPFLAVFALGRIAAAEGYEEFVQLVAGIANDLQRLLGVRGHIHLIAINEGDDLAGVSVGLGALDGPQDVAYLELDDVAVAGPFDWHPFDESEAFGAFELFELLLHGTSFLGSG